MPGYKGHLLGGLATFILLMCAPALWCGTHYGIPLGRMILYLGCALAGALFPDVDIKSRGQKLFAHLAFPALGLLILFKQWAALSITALALLVPLVSRHRGLTHRVWFILVAPFAAPLTIAFLHPEYVTQAFAAYLFFAAGALSHVLLDFRPVSTRLGLRRARAKRR